MTRREIIKQGGLDLTALVFPFPLTSFSKINFMADTKNFDVIIIGGSCSGFSAAMTLGRSMRSVLIIDSGSPCNEQTPHSHNFLTQDGNTPQEILILAKQQIGKHDTVKFLNDLAISGRKTEKGFAITTKTREIFGAKKLIFATGVKDIMPDIKGFSECWGISAIHCPYCHGYEFRHQITAILANGARAIHIASLVNNLTKNLMIITSVKPDFDKEQISKLQKNKIEIIESGIAEIAHENGEVKHVIFKDGSIKTLDAVYVTIPFVQHSDIPEKLGCELTEQGFIKVNAFQKTNVSGVFACGDNTTFMRSIANAVATGNFAGAMANKELCDEYFYDEDKSIIMVEVFITNIQEPVQAERILQVLENTFPEMKINFDLDDCHRILRIEGAKINPESIISIVNKSGYTCEILEDKICK